MGCYAPTKIAPPEVIREIEGTILRPTFEGLRKEGKSLFLQSLNWFDRVLKFVNRHSVYWHAVYRHYAYKVGAQGA
jgi:hypothetical protein